MNNTQRIAQPRAVEGIAEKVIELIGHLPRSARVLDAACGEGYLSEELAFAGFSDFTCVDIDVTGFKLDQSKFKFISADLSSLLPFPDSSFDIIIGSETIEHLENPSVYLRELKRILAVKGVIILTTPNVATLSARIRFLLTGMPEWFRLTNYLVDGHITVLPEGILERLIQAAGLRVDKKTYNVGYLPIISRNPKFRLRNKLLSPLFGWISMYRIMRDGE